MKQRKGRLVRSYFRDIREGLLEEAVFEKRPEGVSSGGDTTRQRGNSKCKGPEAGVSWWVAVVILALRMWQLSCWHQ